ncbi:hypothetical protein FO519_004367 [Halicephalobus sp. NKZ332]|nr:hypothetical protein FO519_004367 [Halicephalobus sp. NKZ332]
MKSTKSAKPGKKMGVSKKGIGKKEPKALARGGKRVSFAKDLTSHKIIQDDVNVSQNFDVTPSKGILKQTKRPASPLPKKVVPSKTPKIEFAEKENDFPVPDFDQEETEQPTSSGSNTNLSKKREGGAFGKRPMKVFAKKKIVVKKSVKEMLLNMTKKERKTFLKELKARKKPNFKLGEDCKQVWEKLRSGRTSEEVKEECIQKLVEMVKGNAAGLIYAHDTCRVIECLISLKREDIRDMLFEELKGEIVNMIKSQYAKFFIQKILKYGTMEQRREIHKAIEGNCVSIYKTTHAASVLEKIFTDYSMATKRNAILCEFYGKEYVLLKRTGQVVKIEDILQLERPKQIAVAENLYDVLEGTVVKQHITFSITHRLLLHFFQICTKDQRTEMIDLLKEQVPQFCHTREGSRAALYCVWYGSPKERKIIVKSFKDLIVNSCKDEFAHRVLLAIFDAVDDTALVNKFITKDLGNYIGEIIFEKYGQWVLHYIVFPRDYRFFLKGTLEILKQGDENEYTKKAADIRYKEIFDGLKKPLLTYMAANMETLLFNKLTSVLVLNMLEPPVANEAFKREIDDEDKVACFKAIAKVAGKEYIPFDIEGEPHIIESGCARFVLASLLRRDCKQERIRLSEYMADLPEEQLASFTAINNGCFLLHYMFRSGSEKAKEVVRGAVKAKALKKLSFQGAIHFTISPSNDVIPFLVGRNVVLSVDSEIRERDRDSSRASSKQLCEYKWADKSNYTGKILSVRDRMVAYRLYHQNTGEAVRVLDRETRSRHLIKDFRARTVDLQWAVHENLLAVVDCDASLHIYAVDKHGETCEKYLNIMKDKSSKPINARITWCPATADGSNLALLALYYNKTVELINISYIKTHLGQGKVEIHANQLSDIPNGYRIIEVDSEISNAKISPDSSALVICTVTGRLIFYITSETELKVAQDFTAIQNHVAEDIIFLDDLTHADPEYFWRYGIVTTDSGRKLWLFDCDDFSLVGKVRIDLPEAKNKLEIQIDLAAKFLFAIDYDAMNMFAFEITNVNGIPHFATVTMIAFFNPLYIAVPVRVEDNLDATGLSLDDDEESNTSLTALFVAISPRSLLEIRVDLEKTLNFEPATSYRPISAGLFESGTHEIETNSSNVSSVAKQSNPKSGGNFVPAPEVEKLITTMEDRFKELNLRFNEVKEELDTVKLEMENVKDVTRSDLITALEGISNELRNRDTKISELVNNGLNRLKDEVIVKIEESTNQNRHQLDINRDRCLEVISNTITHVVVPSLEMMCRELFKQINDQVTSGLTEFNERLKKVHSDLALVAASAAPTPQIPDLQSTVIQLIESEKFQQAFEIALSQKDIISLMTICTKINIDDFFEGPDSPLPQPYLLTILELLSSKLSQETSQKLHIIELVLMLFDIGDDQIHKKTAIQVLKNLNAALEALQKSDPSNKRQIRVVMQLTTNLLKNC